MDNQVKIRGYRIELGEIEVGLEPAPRGAPRGGARARGHPGDKRLVAYVVADEGVLKQAGGDEESTESGARSTSRNGASSTSRPTCSLRGEEAGFNITGWNSSYTGAPIPAEEMREWVDATVERIAARRPRRVLEIGCGTGLLLQQLGPQAERYVGTDFSAVAIERLAGKTAHLPQVELLRRTAEDVGGLQPASFDLVVLNSVVQYFPSIDYLLRVLDAVVPLVAAGGTVFLGDLRHLGLLEAFHASVELYKTAGGTRSEDVLAKAQRQVGLERELCLDPALVAALRQRYGFGSAQVLAKRGRFHNELTCFRYDAVLRMGGTPGGMAEHWLDWQREGLDIAGLRALLERERPSLLGLHRVPDGRTAAARWVLERLGEGGETAASLRARLPADAGIDPEYLQEVAAEVGYKATVRAVEGGGTEPSTLCSPARQMRRSRRRCRPSSFQKTIASRSSRWRSRFSAKLSRAPRNHLGPSNGSGGAMRSPPSSTASHGGDPARSSAITPQNSQTAGQNSSGISTDQRHSSE